MAETNPISRGEPWRTLVAEDGHRNSVRCLAEAAGAVAPRGVVQVLHGLAEHIGRYERFAAACSRHGLAVFGHDHRGHGPGCPVPDLGYFADRGADPLCGFPLANRLWHDLLGGMLDLASPHGCVAFPRIFRSSSPGARATPWVAGEARDVSRKRS